MADYYSQILGKIAEGGADRQNPFEAYLGGVQARNAFDSNQRKLASAYLGGQAVMGDKSALGKYAGYNPEAAQKIMQAQRDEGRKKAEEVANVLRVADTPERYAQGINYLRSKGYEIDPGEDDFANRDFIVAFADQAKSGKTPAELQEYQLAQKQGFGGTILDWHKAKQRDLAPRTQITDLGGRRVLVDQNTGDTIRDLGESPVKQQNAPVGYRFRDDGSGTLERIPGYRDLNYEGELRKEFQGQTKDFRDVRDAFVRIQSSAKSPSAAGDLAMVFNYMKLLDPGSVVRESEFATAENARGVPEGIRNVYNKVMKGERLTPNQRRDFLNRAQQLYSGQEGTFKTLGNRYRGIAERAGLDPGSVVITPDVQESQGQGSNAYDSNMQAVLQEAQEARRRGVSLEAIQRRMEESGFDPSILQGLQ